MKNLFRILNYCMLGVGMFILNNNSCLANEYHPNDYCGYLYVCFICENLNEGRDERDIQQLHFYLSEDGLNWTSVNGKKPAFTAGKDYLKYINESSYNYDKSRVINYGIHSNVYSNEYKEFLLNKKNGRFSDYNVMEKNSLAETVTGDASVLYPFEGNDQGIRDPYIIRGSKKDGSDKDKIWIIATDLNIMSDKYGDVIPSYNFDNSSYGNWNYINSIVGSQNIFVYESNDKFNTWTRRYVDVGSAEKLSESSGMETEEYLTCAWAPEAIYNPDKDNYLVYWSSDLSNSYLGKMIFCCETDDFETFGDVRLYINEKARTGQGGYTCIDASQLEVTNDDNTKSFYRVIKNESAAFICLEKGDSVLNNFMDYNDKNLLADFIKNPNIETANKVAMGNHFYDVEQDQLSNYKGTFEGPTLFKFFDREEWCVMVDNYGYMAGRYFPLTTYDLGDPNSVKKVESGYGRVLDSKTGLPEVACHGGMIPITASEYNSILKVYNSDPDVENYHEINPVEMKEIDPEPDNNEEHNKTTPSPYPSHEPTLSPFSSSQTPLPTESSVIVKKPQRVTGIHTKLGKSRLTIKWKRQKKVKGYQVIIKYKKSGKNYQKRYNVNKNSIIIREKKNITQYTFRVRAYNKEGNKYSYGNYSSKVKYKKK